MSTFRCTACMMRYETTEEVEGLSSICKNCTGRFNAKGSASSAEDTRDVRKLLAMAITQTDVEGMRTYIRDALTLLSPVKERGLPT